MQILALKISCEKLIRHFYNSSVLILFPHSVSVSLESVIVISPLYPLESILSINVLSLIVTIGSLYSEKLLLIPTVLARK